MPAPSLVALCTKACIRNVQSLTDVGDFEYWKIRKILARVTSPEQLHRIELASPQILGEDETLWRAFIQRDIPNHKSKNYVPKNPLKWYEVYKRYKREYAEEVERDKEKLREAMLGIKKEKETHVSKVVDAKYLPRVPKDPRMLANDGGVPISGRRRAQAKPGLSALSFAGGSKTKMSDSAGVLTRARREAKEISSRNKLGQPSHILKAAPSQVLRAPSAMVEGYKRAAKPQVRIFATRRKLEDIGKSQGPPNGPSLEEREKRLRDLTMSSHVTLVGSDSEEDEEEIMDDLFGDTKATQTSPLSKKPYLQEETQHEPNTATARKSHASRAIPTSTSNPTKTPPNLKPSELISSLVGASRPLPANQGKVLPPRRQLPTPSPTSAVTIQHRSSPVKRRSPQPLMMIKRKAPVDIFNRSGGAKRSRVL